MSRPPKADKRTYIRCPWCGKQPVQMKRGRIVSHVSPGNVRCVGGGMTPHPDWNTPQVKPPQKETP